MTDTLVGRLRDMAATSWAARYEHDEVLEQAAAEIERLTRELEANCACDGCGSTESIPTLQARGHLSCCPERKMLNASRPSKPVPSPQSDLT